MTEKRASEIMERAVINGDMHPNMAEYIEALEISIDILGTDYTREQLKNWILVNKYPWLVPKVWNPDTMQYEVYKDYDYTWHELTSLSDGWWKAFGEMMCEEIQAELERCDCVDEFQIIEVKEKFGQARIITNGTPVGCTVNRIIEKYSVLSENICCICGRPDVPMTYDGWWLPSCKDCFCRVSDYYRQKHTQEQINGVVKEKEKSWEQHNKEDNKMRDGYTVISWSKETGETKKTYDISETANKIRKRYYGK